MSKIYVSTFVEGVVGKRWWKMSRCIDTPGLYVMFLRQGQYHGSGIPTEGSKDVLPIIFGWEHYSSEQLVRLIAAHMDAFCCVVFHV